ncbi:MAG: Sun protein [Myxococcales bacterium]|nr:Sun protein [Myxococcales bacterium]
MKAVSGRAIAARVVQRVQEDRAYAAAALAAELSRHAGLDPRERGLATELTYGTLRTLGVLSGRLGQYIPRGFDKTDPTVRAHLLVAAYQISMLDRVPAFAAVDAAVSLVRAERGAKPAGFVNAVLRKLAAGGQQLDRAQAIVDSAPAWLKQRLERDVGADEMRALLGAAGGDPPVAVRTRRGRALPDWLEQAERGRVSPLARLTRGEGDPRRRAGGADVVVQEEGAQVVALSLGVRPGERVLDACAGRGQKSTLLGELLGVQGELWVSDLHPAKLAQLASEHRRLELPEPRSAAVDLSLGVGALPGDFDRILVDAPCTGSGTLRRRPEIALRLGPDDPARMGELQARILENVARLVRPGGRVVYAVCSVFQEEAERVLERAARWFEAVPFDAPTLHELLGDKTQIRLLPIAHGTDGYFVASLQRR